jgi:choline dehydrogenase-like flavoprotein
VLTSVAAPADVVAHYDVCIIGGGTAGLFLAARLLNHERAHDLRVGVVEGADLHAPVLPQMPGADRTAIGRLFRGAWSNTQHLYEGHVTGWLAERRPDYLTSSRLRVLGGTSVIWSGWWLPLEPADLRGPAGTDCRWPFDYQTLEQHYRAVHRMLGLGPYPVADRSSRGPAQDRGILVADPRLATRVVLIKRMDFRERHVPDLIRSPRAQLYPNANFAGFETTTCLGKVRIDAVRVTALDGGRPAVTAAISARLFVLTAGALENTRLLLLSGLGTAAGHCGRHLTDHPYLWTAARLSLTPRAYHHPLYFSSRPVQTGDGVGAVAALVPRPDAMEQLGIGSFRAVFGGADGVPGTINLCWEQEDSPGGTLTLATDLPPDPFGLPRIRLQSDVTDRDRRTPVEALRLLTTALQDAGLARAVETPDLDGDPWSWEQPGRIVPGNHPMGTTRMSAKPADGVVDPQCRVHGTENLFVLGSSVFPRAGHANPTMTTLALGDRLAEHLVGELTR